jgi:chitinase
MRTIAWCLTLMACSGESGKNGAHDLSMGDGPPSSQHDLAMAGDFALSPNADLAGSATPTGQWVMGYYVGYDIDAYPIASIDWSALTHIIFAPLVLKNDLSLDLSFSDQHGTGMADAMALSTAAHAHGVKALLMLGGEGAGGNIATAAGAANRAAFVTKLVNALSTLGYDGIDLDWEDSVNLDDLVSLAQALRAAQPSMILSYPGGAINGNFQTVDPRMATLAQSLDRFNVQTYYPSTAVAGSGWSSWFLAPLSGVSGSTPIAIDDTLQRYVAAGIPKAKLGMGTAFYAICYTGGISAPRQATSGSTQITGGDNDYPLSAFFAAGGTFDQAAAASKKVDATAKEPYLTFTAAVNDSHCGGMTQYISYEDETAIMAKGTFSKANGYGGIIIWTINEGWLPSGASGGRAQNSIMQALKSGFL